MPDQIVITELQLLERLVREDTRNTAQLARDADVGYFWLRKFRNGKIKSPGYEPARKLLLHLCSQ